MFRKFEKLGITALVMSMTLCITGCGNSNTDGNPSTSAISGQTSGSQTTVTDKYNAQTDYATMTDPDHPVNWLSTADFSEPPRDSFEGGLTEFAIEGAIDLEALDSTLAPYKTGKYSHDVYYNTYAELLADEVSMLNGMQFSWTYKDQNKGYYTIDTMGVSFFSDKEREDKPKGINSITVYNFTQDADNFREDTRSVGYCLQQGWWSIDIGQYSPDEALLNIDCDRPKDDDRAFLDAIIEKFGTPDYFTAPSGFDDFAGARETGMGILYYNMVYEYDDFVLLIFLQEDIRNVADAGKEPIYTNIIRVNTSQYFTRACWDKYKESELWDASFLSVYENFHEK